MAGFESMADAIDRIAAERYTKLSDEERVEIDDVLYAADDVAAGRLPLEAFAQVGTVINPYTRRPSAGYTRYLAMLSTPVSDPRRRPLRDAIDALLVLQGVQLTTHGAFDSDELVNVTIRRAPEAWQERQAA